jgi:hypothetical protein
VPEGTKERVLEHVLCVGLVADQGPRQAQGRCGMRPGELLEFS